uniref:Hairy-related 5 n=1 Tax=Salarias fasciatus TaxID=181472 RepID=A0A672HNT7_SALFA
SERLRAQEHPLPTAVSKPVMEKRRRERINSSLEALRLLMVDSTDNEKLKNPKVEKAEILESVVQFLKTERQTDRGQQAARRAVSGEPVSSCAPQQSYHDGVRSCMLRVNHFMRQGAKENSGAPGNQVPFGFPVPRPPLCPPELMRGPPVLGAALAPQQLPRPYLGSLHYSPRELLAPPGLPVAVTDAVWRPWPK